MSARTKGRVLLWGAIAGAFLTIMQVIEPAVNAVAAVSKRWQDIPATSDRVTILEASQKASAEERREMAERLYYIDWWVTQMGKKAGIPAPPRRRYADRGTP